jgi:hypothetical protein
MIWADDLQSSVGLGGTEARSCIMRINVDLLRNQSVQRRSVARAAMTRAGGQTWL